MEHKDILDKMPGLTFVQLQLLWDVMNGRDTKLKASGPDVLALIIAGFLKNEDGKITKAFQVDNFGMGDLFDLLNGERAEREAQRREGWHV